MTGAALIQLIAAIGGSSALAAIISVFASRRKNNAEVAEIWNRLTKDALEREERERIEIQAELERLKIRQREDQAKLVDQEKQIRLCNHKYDSIALLCRRMIREMAADRQEDYARALEFIDDSVA